MKVNWKSNKNRIVTASISSILLIIGLVINPHRKVYTAQILELPAWTHKPWLLIEHFLGNYFLGMFIFSIFILCMLVPYIPTRIAAIFTNDKTHLLNLQLVEIGKLTSKTITLVFPIVYEFIIEHGKTLYQLPFDMLGLLLFIGYINKAYPTRNIWQFIKSEKLIATIVFIFLGLLFWGIIAIYI